MTSNTPGLVTDPLVRRVMKARYPGTCVRCFEPIEVGNLIALLRGVGWAHVRPCVIPDPAPVLVYAA